MQVNHRLNRLVDYCAGKETQTDAIGAVARYLAAHIIERPAAGKPSRWHDIEALKVHARHYGPPVTETQIDAALAAAIAGLDLADAPGLPAHPPRLHP